MNQYDLGKKPKQVKQEYVFKERKRKSNPRQDLLERVTSYFGATKDFKRWLFQLKNYSNDEINEAWKWLVDKARTGNIQGRGQGLFFWKLKQERKRLTLNS